METLTSFLTLLAHSFWRQWRAATVVFLLAASPCARLAAQQVTVLDLTEPHDYRPPNRFPGAGGGGVSGTKVGPILYEIPLKLRVLRVTPEKVAARDKFVLEIELRNPGPGVFFLPVSRDIEGLQRNQHKGRRFASVLMGLDKEGEPTKIVALLAGSESVPGSLKRLNPGDSVVVRAETDFSTFDAAPLVSSDDEKAVLLASYREMRLKDGQFFVANRSEALMSTGMLEVLLSEAP